MTTEREYREWQERKQKYQKSHQKSYKKYPEKGNNFILWLSVIIILLSVFNTIKNKTDLIPIKEQKQLQTFANLFGINVNYLKSLTEKFVIDIDEPIQEGNSKTLKKNPFFNIDNKAKSIKYEGNSVSELAEILAQNASTDLEKARIIYTWITHNIAYDTSALLALKSGVYPDVKSTAVLNTRQTICSGYANLYQQLASEMGLKSVIVLGYAKGLDYIVGQDSSVNHAWNAVKIDEKWYLIDTTWGAGTVNNGSFSPLFNPYYFASPPEEFIYSHFPENSKWQLLNQPLSRQNFDVLPNVSMDLFKNNIQLVSHQNKSISTNNNLSVTLKVPQDVVAIANLKLNDQEVEKNYILVQKNKENITINTAFPTAGNYKLEIFAKKEDNSKYYPHIVTYDVIAHNATEKFPLTYSHFYQNNGYVETPLTKSLNTNQFYYFKLKIENAIEVKILDESSNNWTDLIKYGDLFAGSARITTGKVIVFAKFPEDNRYWALLEYN